MSNAHVSNTFLCLCFGLVSGYVFNSMWLLLGGQFDICLISHCTWELFTESCMTLGNHMDYSPPSMVFSWQEYWSGLPFPPPGESSCPRDLLHHLHWQVDSLPNVPPRCNQSLEVPKSRSTQSYLLERWKNEVWHQEKLRYTIDTRVFVCVLRESSSQPGHGLWTQQHKKYMFSEG